MSCTDPWVKFLASSAILIWSSVRKASLSLSLPHMWVCGSKNQTSPPDAHLMTQDQSLTSVFPQWKWEKKAASPWNYSVRTWHTWACLWFQPCLLKAKESAMKTMTHAKATPAPPHHTPPPDFAVLHRIAPQQGSEGIWAGGCRLFFCFFLNESDSGVRWPIFSIKR